jgi:hypothetical protein
MGSKTPFDRARLDSLYGTDAGYAAKMARAVDRLVQERWLTDGDARRLKATR